MFVFTNMIQNKTILQLVNNSKKMPESFIIIILKQKLIREFFISIFKTFQNMQTKLNIP